MTHSAYSHWKDANPHVTFPGVPLLRGAVVLLAVLVFARRASTGDPAVALRGDGQRVLRTR